MSALPSVDLYATLEVERTATTAEITASYRRLARVHHPDKNPGNEEAATTAFQKIQLAYEVLSNPEKRAQYDARTSTGSTAASFGPGGPFNNPSASSAESNDYFDFLHEILRGMRPEPPRPQYTEAERRWRQECDEVIREWRNSRQGYFEQEQELAKRRAEYRQKLADEEAEKKLREAAKQSRLQREKDLREELRSLEKAKQEARWVMHQAVTKDERLQTCLHSEYCAKIPQRQKFKCEACKVKRGITAFECPHCQSLICQQCVVDFTYKRAMPEKARARQPEPVAKKVEKSSEKPAKKVEKSPEKPVKEPETSDEDEDEDYEKQPSARPQFGRGYPRKPQGPLRCYKCHQLGHVAKYCRSRPEKKAGFTIGDKNLQGKRRGGGGTGGNGQARGQ